MHSSWLKCFVSSTAVLVIVFLTPAYAQPPKSKVDQCVISFSSATMTKARQIAKSENEDEVLELKRLGEIDISKVSEGTNIEKTYQIPNSQLNVLVELLFDDDLSRNLGGGASVPADAMTVWLTVWSGAKRSPASVLAQSINQTALMPSYFRSITTAYARNGSKIYFVNADCTMDSDKEDDKR